MECRENAARVRRVNPCTSLGIGLAGFGTVGSGVWNTLNRNGELITGRTGGGVTLHIAKILVRDLAKVRATTSEVAQEIFTTDWRSLVADPAVDIVVELIGGTTDAFDIVAAALRLSEALVQRAPDPPGSGKPSCRGRSDPLNELGLRPATSR